MAVTVTLTRLLTGAVRKTQAIGLNEPLPGNDLPQLVEWANQMIDGWGLEPGTIPFEQREVFALTASRGGTVSPYTIGPGGDFDTTRPDWLAAAGLLQVSLTPHVEIPRDVLTDAAYRAIAIKDLESEYFTGVYYNPTYPLGTIQLYPVPNTTINALVLYTRPPIASFTSLTAQYTFPPGYAQVIEDNLAVLFADVYGRALPPSVIRRASHGLSLLKRANLEPVDLVLDPALTDDAKRPWNILSDS